MSLLTRRMLGGQKDKRIWGVRNGSFEYWSGTLPDEWTLASSGTGFGWYQNSISSYVSDGTYCLYVYKSTSLSSGVLSGLVELKQDGILVDTSTFSKLVFDLTSVAFVTGGYDQDIYFSAGLHSESLGALTSVEYNWWYGQSASERPSSITLTIPTSARNKTLDDVSIWMDFDFEVSATIYRNIICTIDNVRFE